MSFFFYYREYSKRVVKIAVLLIAILNFSHLWAIPKHPDIGKEEDAICGIWYTNNNNSKVEIFRKNGRYFGKIIWLKDPGKSAYTNKLVIAEMIYNESRHTWDNGNLYYPMKNAQYQGILELFNNDTLSIRVYKGTPLIGKTFTWIRVK